MMDGTPNQKINATLTREVQGTTTVWIMDIAGQGKGGPNGYPPAKVAHGSGADFKFVIAGEGTQNINFSGDPIWVVVDNGSGKSPDGTQPNSPEIVDVKVTGGKMLTFTDKNITAGDLTYQLNFTGADPLDPIIQNGGGGGNLYSYVYLAGAVLLLAAVGFFVWRKFAGRTKV